MKYHISVQSEIELDVNFEDIYNLIKETNPEFDNDQIRDEFWISPYYYLRKSYKFNDNDMNNNEYVIDNICSDFGEWLDNKK